jgi:biotin operon repressor
MTFIEQLLLLQRVDKLITRKGTGCANQLARLLGISRSSVFNYLECLRQLGGEIDYCKSRQTYFYANNQKPRFPTLSKADTDEMYGGKNLFDFFDDRPRFLDCGTLPLYQVD